MPTGSPLRVPPPPGVLVRDPLADDAGGMLPSSLNLITRFGALVSRPGLTALGQALTAGERVLGMFWTRTADGHIHLLIGTSKRWWSFNTATRQWDDLSGGVLLGGALTMPVTFAYFGQGDFEYILGVNDTDAAKEWKHGDAAYADVATGYIARSLCVVANRVLYGHVTIGGVRFPTMVAWSAAGDRTSNPALARNKLLDTGDQIVAVRRMNRLSGVIYRERSKWIATAVQGSDAKAFAFTVADQEPGPVGPMAVGEDPGFRHIYFGSDLNLWTFDGTASTLLAITAGLLGGRVTTAALGLVSVAYDPLTQEVWVTLPLDGDTVPTWVMVYAMQTQGIFFGRLPVACAACSTGSWQVELETPTHLLPDVPTHLLPDVPTHQLGFQAGQEVLILGADAQVYTVEGSADAATAIPVTFEWLMPTAAGVEHEFDAVELMVEPPGAPITVAVLVGPTYDHLTEIVLGIIDPSLTPPTYPDPPEDVPGGPNLSVVRGPEVMRGRIVVVRLTATVATPLKVRRIELFQWARRIAA